jgi:GTPase SAR1 family protein
VSRNPEKQTAQAAPQSFASEKPAQGSHATYDTIIIMGPSGFGKTALADELLTGYEKRGGMTWIVDPFNNWPHHPRRWWGGKAALDAWLDKMARSGPGMIAFDDADLYMRFPTATRLDFVVGNRHLQKHQLFITRRPQGIHKDIFQIASALAVFHQRQQYARDYLNKEIDDKFSRRIPREKFQYLYHHVDTSLEAVYSTKPRAVVTASDIVSR